MQSRKESTHRHRTSASRPEENYWKSAHIISATGACDHFDLFTNKGSNDTSYVLRIVQMGLINEDDSITITSSEEQIIGVQLVAAQDGDSITQENQTNAQMCKQILR